MHWKNAFIKCIETIGIDCFTFRNVYLKHSYIAAVMQYFIELDRIVKLMDLVWIRH